MGIREYRKPYYGNVNSFAEYARLAAIVILFIVLLVIILV